MIQVYSDPACARHVNPNSSVEAPERLAAALEGVMRARAAGAELDLSPPAPASREALEAVHDPRYLDGLLALSEAGGGYLDGDTATNAHSWEAATLASGAAVAAVDSAMGGTPSFALVRPPGHHAGGGYGMGFCLLNHAAVAAAHARSSGAGRVAILDWDVHHGNGTQDIFYDRADVLYLSVHRSPFYPGTGRLGETGQGAGRGFTVNVPLPARSGVDRYAAAFSGVLLPVLREFEPEVVIVSAGYDAHLSDPLGGMALDENFFGEAAAAVAAVTRETPGCAPPALVLEGGYDLNALSGCVEATLAGLNGAGAPGWVYRPEGAPGPVREAREALAPFWESLRD
ncbi:MAG: Deacetylases, including yeast histone deacetylase and acetoin utilization protein [uncultured Rubrobacteraceae bacterium]|uniref:Deacetylases, including yeast histone deacetylase and acetoin utilization protein n=1 Tax=uncultured Rubrobacteraceae bacterium TaxID=349277 RepID=A0A6J4RSB6_9ACTN|nr:MAG: Deacetylases, including yeast histone deacetylase and acetoin utilization protein [uncultured Rubrobacteraceae bacterium]